MHISKILAVSLAVVSGSAMAFQAKVNDVSMKSPQQLRSVEYAIYGHVASVSQAQGVTGTCAAVPVNGCGCPFCTQLRSANI